MNGEGMFVCDLTVCPVCQGNCYLPDGYPCGECDGTGQNPYYALDHDNTVTRTREDDLDD